MTAESRPAWLQFWLQLTPSQAVRGSARPFMPAGEAAYGTAVNRHERDHDGLAVWGLGVRIPSAPPFRPGRSLSGRAASSSLVPARWPLEQMRCQINPTGRCQARTAVDNAWSDLVRATADLRRHRMVSAVADALAEVAGTATDVAEVSAVVGAALSDHLGMAAVRLAVDCPGPPVARSLSHTGAPSAIAGPSPIRRPFVCRSYPRSPSPCVGSRVAGVSRAAGRGTRRIGPGGGPGGAGSRSGAPGAAVGGAARAVVERI
jgi:hypothetical protein